METIESRLYVHVGITGHLALPTERLALIEQRIGQILDAVVASTTALYCAHEAFFKPFFQGNSPVFRVVSSLAAGADTLAAEQALSRGFRLLAPIPFGEAEYATDFEEGAQRNKFHQLLSLAEQKLFLCADSKGVDSSKGYANASEVMLCHSDILIAVWNGNVTKYKAGTYATIRAARRAHLPVLVIRTDSSEVSISYLTYAAEHHDWQEHLSAALSTMLLPADDEQNRSARTMDPMLKHWCHFLTSRKKRVAKDAERQPLLFPITNRDYKYKGTTFSNIFCNFLAWLHGKPLILQHAQPQKLAADDLPDVIKHADSLWSPFKDVFSPAAGYYGKVFRESLFCKYFLPVICMVSVIIAINFNNISFGKAFIAVLNEGVGLNMITLLLLILGLVMAVSIFSIVITLTGQNNRVVHGRFTTYRILAERCRNSKFLWAVGYACVSSPRFNPGPVRWETWYYRLMVRQLGMPSTCLQEDTLRTWLRWLREGFLAEQARYHEGRIQKSHSYNEALFMMSRAAFYAGIVMSMLRILLGEFVKFEFIAADTAEWLLPLFGTLTLLCPCVGTFLMAYSAFAGYPTDITASRTMESTFDTLLADIDALLASDCPVAYDDVLSICRRVDEYCLGDVCNWESSLTSNKAWLR